LEGAGFAVERCELVTRRRHLADGAAVRDWLVDEVLPAWLPHVETGARTAFAAAAVARVRAGSPRPDGGMDVDDVRLVATSFSTGSAAPHAFPGAAGDAADGLAETARWLTAARSRTQVPEARIALWHRRFEVAAAVARHDPAAARSLLDALRQEVAEAVDTRPPSP
jgi:hypothetical protein